MNTKLITNALVLLALLSNAIAAQQSSAGSGTNGLQPSDIFRFTNVWTVHLSLTPEQWEAMEPKQNRQAGGRRGGSFLQGPEGGRNGIAAAFGYVYDYVRADLEFGTNRFKDVGVRYKGNGTFLSSRESLKRSLKLDLNQFVKGQKLAGMSQLNLHNSVRDPSGMNEAIAYRLFQDGGVPAPKTAYAKVYVTVPGKHDRRYLGLYDLIEDVGNTFAEERFGVRKGAVFKPVTPNLFSNLGDEWKSYNQTYDPKGELTEDQKRRVIEFSKFVSAASDSDFAAKVADYVDLDNVTRYMALTTWLVDMDGILGPGQNYYLYLHPKTQKFHFVPWDQDQPFGQFPRGTQEQRENLSIHKPWTGQNRFLDRLYKCESFQKLYLARLAEFNKTILQPDRIHQQTDMLAAILRAPIQEESPARLAEFQKAASGEKMTVAMGPGLGDTPVVPLKSFIKARGRSIADQLEGKLEGKTIGTGFGR
ncbi:MAG: CotH kinase family protein [Verrucomicrobiales bacterium]|nr:CotH kinase family protein [Verrucomicrobiales bacterium]